MEKELSNQEIRDLAIDFKRAGIESYHPLLDTESTKEIYKEKFANNSFVSYRKHKLSDIEAFKINKYLEEWKDLPCDSAEDTLNDVAFGAASLVLSVIVILLVHFVILSIRFFSHPRKWMFLPMAYIVAAATIIGLHIGLKDAFESGLGSANFNEMQYYRSHKVLTWLNGVHYGYWILAWYVLTMLLCCIFYPLWKKIKEKWFDRFVQKSGNKIAAVLMIIGAVFYAVNPIWGYALVGGPKYIKLGLYCYWPILMVSLTTIILSIWLLNSHKKASSIPFFLAPVLLGGLIVISIVIGNTSARGVFLLAWVQKSYLQGTLLMVQGSSSWRGYIMMGIYVLTVIFMAVRIVSGKKKFGWIPMLGAELLGVFSIVNMVAYSDLRTQTGMATRLYALWPDVITLSVPVFIYFIPVLALLFLTKHYSLKES